MAWDYTAITCHMQPFKKNMKQSEVFFTIPQFYQAEITVICAVHNNKNIGGMYAT